MEQFIIILFVGIIIAALIMFFIKSAIKVAVAIAIVWVVLNVGWIWSGDEIMDKLMLDRVIKDEYQVLTEYLVDEYAKKRDEHNIVDAKEIENIVAEIIKSAPATVSKSMENIDKEKLIKDIKEKLELAEDIGKELSSEFSTNETGETKEGE